MRQGFIAAATFAAGLSLLSPANAATAKSHAASAPAFPKVAVIDVQGVLSGCQRGREAVQSLQQKQTELRTQAKDLKDKRDALKDQVDKADAKSSNYATLQKQFQDADSQLQSFLQEGQQLLQERNQEMLGPIQQELGSVLNVYVKEHHIDILLGKGGPAGALYAAEPYDATADVISAMDKDWDQIQKTQATAPATPAPAASTKH